MLEELLGRKIPIERNDWRPGDQRVFYADIRSAKKDLAWQPKVDVETGIKKLFDWIEGNRGEF
jgi:CDP-paratose 2-epimerase